MAELNIRRMFEAGAHFGHQARFWNPRMAPYIYGERNKIHIIDLDTALPMLKSALDYLKTVSASGGKVLFVGTKRAARESIVRHARRCGMPYVSHRWLGGMLTNFKTVRLSVKRYTDLEEQRDNGEAVKISKKQALRRDREIAKLGRNLEGIKDMARRPDAMFVIDVRHEKIAVREAVKLEVPIVAVVDTNNSLEGVDYVIPGNDDAIRAVELYVSAAADAVLEGIAERETEVAGVVSRDEIKGVISIAPRTAEKAREKPAPAPARPAAARTAGKTDGKSEPAARPKVRMRGLFNRLRKSQAEHGRQEQAAGESAPADSPGESPPGTESDEN